MEDFKLWWQSKTIIGALVTALCLGLYLLGIGPTITGAETSALVDVILLLFGSGGILTTIYGRYTASKQVALTTTETDTTTS